MRLLCAMAMTPESGVMMRFWDCCGLWWDKLWMLVRVLTGGSPPPETEICRGARQESHRQRHSRGAAPGPPPCHPTLQQGDGGAGGQERPLRRGGRAAASPGHLRSSAHSAHRPGAADPGWEAWASC